MRNNLNLKVYRTVYLHVTKGDEAGYISVTELLCTVQAIHKLDRDEVLEELAEYYSCDKYDLTIEEE